MFFFKLLFTNIKKGEKVIIIKNDLAEIFHVICLIYIPGLSPFCRNVDWFPKQGHCIIDSVASHVGHFSSTRLFRWIKSFWPSCFQVEIHGEIHSKQVIVSHDLSMYSGVNLVYEFGKSWN